MELKMKPILKIKMTPSKKANKKVKLKNRWVKKVVMESQTIMKVNQGMNPVKRLKIVKKLLKKLNLQSSNSRKYKSQ